MINLILIFPIVACLILLVFKKQILNNIMIVLYAFIHLAVSIAAMAGKELIPFWQNTNFFAFDELNKIFLLVLSVIYLAVATYNIGYMKDDMAAPRKLRHYAYMVLFFMFSMTGAILSNNLGLT